ncbi:MAG: hypothetical protein KatS3mg040_0049 [Candidatus Kapaibacterium sp.]|nr:MAG: hypothetical protein KatS3mg040_0049 [Candidatus Kapabacteria bacterium]
MRNMLLLFLIVGSSLHAQRFPDRWVALNPLLDSSRRIEPGTLGWMHSLVGWGEFGGYLSGDREHAWIQRLGALIELVRMGERSSLAFASEIEFIANPDNDIRFNPRAVFWQEGFLFTHQIGTSYWQLGYYHRCKHDVDNLDIGRQRSLIYGSIVGKYLIPIAVAGFSGGAVARGDLYTIRLDDRTPPSDGEDIPNVERLLSTLSGSIHLRRGLADPWLGLYANAWMSANFYTKRPNSDPNAAGTPLTRIQGGIAAGIAITGAAHFRIGISYEYLADTGINPLPEASPLLALTLAVLNPTAMW